MRIVVIDAYTKTITEQQMAKKPHTRALREALRPTDPNAVTIAATVENGATGDRFYIDRSPPHDAPSFMFLGDRYQGRGVIAGRDLNVDADVPLKRVQTQVSF